MATIEERVARLEAIEENRHLDAALRAQAYGINLLHVTLAEAQAAIGHLDEKLDGLAVRVDANHVEVNGKLDAILARLDRD